ncbi:LeuA family protein [Vulcanisaeta thermophila]|uniref:LeuA family protein n=1 Tax=Vulcanisaeta thermophila TaxID=867917 RepID=UPI000852B2E7|nr:hypothetical protein [Vulcanisaeta thermophila]
MIIDDTLREGLQAPGISFTVEEKIELARLISNAGVDEAIVSHPSAHESEVEVTRTIVERNYFKYVFGLGRALKEDIDLIASTGANISTYVPFEPQLVNKSLDVIKYAVNTYGKGKLIIEVGITNITAYEPSSIVKLAKTLEELGVDRIQLADSLGKATPKFMYNIVNNVKHTVKIPVSVHCHNDMGAAVANSISSVYAGADYVDATIYGIGERNGIADLATIAMILKNDGYRINIDFEKLRDAYNYLAKLIIDKIGIEFFRNNFPVFGDNVSVQTAGTHATYPGVFKEARYSLNVYVGRSTLRKVLSEFGISLNDQELLMLMKKVKDTAVRTGRAVTYDQLLRLIDEIKGELHGS